MVSAKFLDDAKINNAAYAKIGGIKEVQELNLLEIEFLQSLNYILKIDRATFNDVLLAVILDEGRPDSAGFEAE